MIKNQSPEEFYKQRTRELTAALAPLVYKRKIYGWLRLILVIGLVVLLWYTITSGQVILLLPFAGVAALFLYIISSDLKNSDLIKNAETLIGLNEDEIKSLHHQFSHFPDGSEFKDPLHGYTGDLDIFGHASLYQYINRTNSEQGNRLIAQWLMAPANNETIKSRQESVRELSDKPAWRQQLQAHGLRDKILLKTEDRVKNWVMEENKFIHSGGWKILRYALPFLSLLSLGLYLADILGSSLFYLLLTFFFLLSLYTSKLVQPAYLQLNKIAGEMDTLSESLLHIEKEAFRSESLQQLQSGLKSKETGSSIIIKNFKKFIDRLDYRLNPLVFFPLNTFLFWDIQQIFSLESWKEDHKQDIGRWFETLASFEALSSFGTLAYNHPGWSYPSLTNNDGVFETEELGHPLIPASKRVCSSFSTSGLAQLGLITGSNMAGKSTFLRSVGVNMVLAMAGAPVCAKRLSGANMKIMSSMRISDNLEESTSTFYAELKKLKQIIEAVNNKEKVFLLLDEILRGTNSGDRHTGSAALIKQLIQQEACGLIATHDLELAKLADQYPAHIHNYHFDVQVSGEELYFDYKLKRGVCKSMNASLLMKKIGIEL